MKVKTSDNSEFYEQVANQLAEQDYALINDFSTAGEVSLLRKEIDSHHKNDKLSKAGIGKVQHYKVDKEIRGDYIQWIDPERASAPVKRFLDQIDLLMQNLNQLLFLSLKDFECHFALYPPGTFYGKHLDQFRGSNQRKLSFAFYLNPNWVPNDGGELRLYLPEGALDIAPLSGSLAIFRSDTVEHEVLSTKVNRYSITGWMRDRPLDFPLH